MRLPVVAPQIEEGLASNTAAPMPGFTIAAMLAATLWLMALAAPAAAYTPPETEIRPPGGAGTDVESRGMSGPASLTRSGKSSLPPAIQSGADDPLPEDGDGQGPMHDEGMSDEFEFGDDPHAQDLDTMPVPAAPTATLADIRYGDGALPEPVAATRAALMAAARSGDVDALRPIFTGQRGIPIVALDETFNGYEADPVAHLILQSGDDEGHEILAILLEVLEAGHVAIRDGAVTTYVWPYYAHVPLGDLSPRHKVEVYRLLTSIDVEEIERMGHYTFFRVGIAADGRLRYFSAGVWE